MKITVTYPMTSTGPTHLSKDWLIRKEIELDDEDILAIGDAYIKLREKRERVQVRLNKYCETCKYWNGKNFEDEPCSKCNNNNLWESKGVTDQELADMLAGILFYNELSDKAKSIIDNAYVELRGEKE